MVTERDIREPFGVTLVDYSLQFESLKNIALEVKMTVLDMLYMDMEHNLVSLYLVANFSLYEV